MHAGNEKLIGTVTPFRGNGRRLGYPTANITTESSLSDGVYFGYADLGAYHHHPALLFIGTPTTIGDSERRAEAHLLDIEDKDYYGEQLSAQVVFFHRPNQKFDALTDLIAAMKADERTARKWFAGHKYSAGSKV